MITLRLSPYLSSRCYVAWPCYGRVLSKMNLLFEEQCRRSYELHQEKMRQEAEIQKYVEELRKKDVMEYNEVVQVSTYLNAMHINFDLNDLTGDGPHYSAEEEDTFDVFFETAVKCLKFAIPIPTNEKDKVSMKCMEEFDISEFLEAQYNRGRSIIFQRSAGKRDLVNDWVINVEGQTTLNGQMFNQFWENMGNIKITFMRQSINLFRSGKFGFLPKTDDDLDAYCEMIIRNARIRGVIVTREELTGLNQDLQRVRQKIELYYRAVGVFFFRAIVGGYPIAAKAMPRFLRNGK